MILLQVAVLVDFATWLFLVTDIPEIDWWFNAGLLLKVWLAIWSGGIIVFLLLKVVDRMRRLNRVFRVAAAPKPKWLAASGIWDQEIDG
jgi:hypothetical protein